ncbi:MAG TPA: fibronectin type III domain-containing protein [Solirubrobacterales bacterium]|nr:fibronectin type III domain-containing protein [Solirubrobacterales bacterium]
MTRHAKAATAGSTKRRAGRLGRIFRGALATRASSSRGPGGRAPKARRLALPTAVLAAIVAALVLLAGLANAATSAITEPATSIGGTHATLNGVVNPEGVEPEECLFEWGESYSGPYTETVPCAETPAEIGSGTSPVPVHADITGLKPQGVYYHFRLAVVNSPSETLYGANRYFRTLYDVVTEPPTSNTGTRATLAGTVNPEGVEPEECFFEWGENVPGPPVYGNVVPCAETPAEIGTGTTPVAVHADISGLVPQGQSGTFGDPGRYEYRLVAKNPNATVDGANREFVTPNTVVTIAASGVTLTEATVNGTVNPDTATISACVFEWGPLKEAGEAIQHYPETSPCVPGPGSITGTSPVAVHADLSGLQPGTEYVYRLKATYPTGPILGADETVLTLGPVIAAAWSDDVVRTEATLKAEINPEGVATSYRFEWGKTASYEAESAESSVGSDSSPHVVSLPLDKLEPGTTYHYRVVAANADGINEGADRTFTTYDVPVLNTTCPNQALRSGPGAFLPDCRGYEMVSPVDKGGGGIIAGNGFLGEGSNRGSFDQASVNGDKVTYTSQYVFAGEPSNRRANQYMSTRSADGWATEGISAPRDEAVLTGISLITTWVFDTQFQLFSDDLSQAWLKDSNIVPLASGAYPGFVNLYRRDNTTGTYRDPAITSAPLAWDEEEIDFNSQGRVLGIFHGVVGAAKDGSHLIFEARAQLTPEAQPNHSNMQIYDSTDGALHLISVLPGGETTPGGAVVGVQPAPGVAYVDLFADRAVSEDGSHVFWTSAEGLYGTGRLYVRIDDSTTVPVSESVTTNRARFWTASTDGSKVVFSFDPEGTGTASGVPGDLYEFDVATETPTLIAHDIHGVLGASDDLSYLYFTSRAVLAGGATPGEENLYVRHDGAVKFIATVSPADGNRSYAGLFGSGPREQAVRVSPDGRTLAFMSQRSLTGYDNTDAVDGKADTEVYVYSASSDQLSCVSCNPTGARPHGGGTAEGGYKPGSPEVEGSNWRTAAWIPPWERELHEAKVLSNDGNRLFFNARDALLPQDVNGVQDVYQWEAVGTGDCRVGNTNYFKANNGCISLISTGKSPGYSEIVDAGADGSDVFIRTESSIDARDPGLMDIYDARVDGGFAPPPPPPPPCVGDACQNVPEPPVEPTPSSSTFRGAGNLQPRANCRAAAKRAGRLSRRARRIRRVAHRVPLRRRRRILHRRAGVVAKRARRLRVSAKRCRRANRRAGR